LHLMKKPTFFLILSLLLLAACGEVKLPSIARVDGEPAGTQVMPLAKPEDHNLTVFAAASLADAFTEIGDHFEAAHPGTTVTINFAGSQTLSTQLAQGAVADVFASANHTEMDKMVAAHLVAQDAPVDFATNRLLVILPEDNPAKVQTLQDLTRIGLKLVLADATVPAGKYAREILEKMSLDPTYGNDFSTRVLANVVSNETDVKLAVTKVQLGEADAGIVYFSDAVAAPGMKTIEIPPDFNVVARYPIVVLANAPQAVLAAEFVACVLSTEGQAILKKWGFTPVLP